MSILKELTGLTAILAFMCASCAQQEKSVPKTALNTRIDAYISNIMDVQNIPGVAVAVIKNNKVIHKEYYGKSSLEEKTTVNPKTLFRLYSLTKLMTTVGAFQLIEDQKMSLDDELSNYLDDLPKQWRSVKIVNLLSHSSGLPDVHRLTKELGDSTITDKAFIKLLYTDEMDFTTGEEWRYNQTNFLLLKEIIEKITQMKFEDYILKNQFQGASIAEALFSSDPFENIPNRAKYYDFDREANVYKMKPEFPGKRSHPLNGMNLTLDTYITWDKGLDTDEFINDEMKALMWTPFAFKKSDREFLNGWDVYDVNGYKSYGFSGGSVSGYRKFTDKNLSLIVLTNGYKYYSVQDHIIDHIAGMIDKDLKDDDFIIRERTLATYFLTGNSTSIENMYSEVKEKNQGRNLEKIFKSIGYQLFFGLDRKQEAIELFKLNVIEYPESYDTYGSLGYLYFLTDQLEPARENYVKALELNPKNSYSKRTIKKIDEALNKSH